MCARACSRLGSALLAFWQQLQLLSPLAARLILQCLSITATVTADVMCSRLTVGDKSWQLNDSSHSDSQAADGLLELKSYGQIPSKIDTSYTAMADFGVHQVY